MSDSDLHADIKMPIWARLFLQFGFPTAVAILLLATLLGWMPSPLMEAIKRIEYQAWVQSRTLRAICYQSVTSEERRYCDPYKEQQ